MITPSDAIWMLPGLLVGALHFHGLRRNTALYLAGSAGLAIALHVARMGFTTGVLVFAAWQGAWPLLCTAAGFLLARLLLVRPLPPVGEG